MLTPLQSTVDPAAANALGTLVGLGGLATVWLWLRVFYRSSGI